MMVVGMWPIGPTGTDAVYDLLCVVALGALSDRERLAGLCLLLCRARRSAWLCRRAGGL